jgi:HPt (histidine-containing phosphotransfer) domain-containing protein
MKDVNYLKENGFNIDSIIEMLGDIETFDEILNDFISGPTEEKLILYKNNMDMPNYAIIVHNLKGESSYLGMEKLTTMAEEHQIKSESNDVNYINENFDALIVELRRVNEVAKVYLGL